MAPTTKQELTENEKKMFEAIAQGNAAEVKRLLSEQDVKVDCLDENGMTPLQQAAYKANKEICEMLLNSGADVNSNYQQHGYTALMFAALSGSLEVTKLMLEAGAKVYEENAVGRNAAQMAAFVGQHQCVSLINNFFSREDLDYFTKPNGFETEPKLPPTLAPALYNFILNNNLHPVKLCMLLEEQPDLLNEGKKISSLFDTLCERAMKSKNTNEVMGLKFHYLAHIVKHCCKNKEDLETCLKNFIKGRSSDGFPEKQEVFLRSMIRDFPYSENALIQQIVRTLAPVKIGGSPSALSVMDSSINGQRMANEEDMPCCTCNTLKAMKKCSVCKCVNYCDQRCQKLHWSTHKKFCKDLKTQRELAESQQKLEALKAGDSKPETEKADVNGTGSKETSKAEDTWAQGDDGKDSA